MLGPQGVDEAKDWVGEGTRDRGGDGAACNFPPGACSWSSLFRHLVPTE